MKEKTKDVQPGGENCGVSNVNFVFLTAATPEIRNSGRAHNLRNRSVERQTSGEESTEMCEVMKF